MSTSQPLAPLPPSTKASSLFPHLSLVVTEQTMTTADVPVGALPMRYLDAMIHHRPVPVGEDDQGHPVYPVLHTWGFLPLPWQDAGKLARLLMAHQSLHMVDVVQFPAEHLVSRLLYACFPLYDVVARGKEAAQRARRDPRWGVLFDDTTSPAPSTSRVLMERQEAAELAQLLATAQGVSSLDGVDGSLDAALLRSLLAFAAPPLLFGSTAHALMEAQSVQDGVLRGGQEALPMGFRADRDVVCPDPVDDHGWA